MGKALIAGGIRVMELTLRTPAALESLRRIRQEVPDMVAGVGTILTQQQCAEAKEAGGVFGVAPGLNPDVVEKASRLGFPFAPGIATASDIERAVVLDCNVLKFFPGESLGGLRYLRALNSPYAHLSLRFIPLGADYDETARAVVDAILDKYAADGITTIEDTAVLRLPPVSHLGGIKELVQPFGGTRNDKSETCIRDV